VSIGARSVALVTGMVAVLGLPLVISLTADAADDVLLSKGHPTLASSTAGPAYGARLVVDGTTGSRWASAAGPVTQWVRVDLGVLQQVDRVKLSWDKAYAKTYQIQVSVNGTSSWRQLAATVSGNGGTDDLKRLSGGGRYLRVLATRPGTSYGYSLKELQVYGPGPVAVLHTSPSAVMPSSSAQPASGSSARPTSGATALMPTATGLDDPSKKEIALQLVASAENSTLNWRGEYGYIEDLGDGRGYTGGLIGFCSGTSDMLAVVAEYTRREPGNPLARYLPALRTVDGSDSHAGLDPGFTAAWKKAAADPVFQKTQEDERDRAYFDPSVKLARQDGLRALGQFAYFDAAVMHGLDGLRQIRADAMRFAEPPTQGGDERVWLNAFLDARSKEMRTESAHSDTSRVDDAQRVFLKASNLDLDLPLAWSVYGDEYSIAPGR
jgi:chitosanase